MESADTAPTKPDLEVFEKLNSRLNEELKQWAQIKSEEIPKVEALIKQADVPALSVKAKPPGQ
jgi:hypothetical protein